MNIALLITAVVVVTVGIISSKDRLEATTEETSTDFIVIVKDD